MLRSSVLAKTCLYGFTAAILTCGLSPASGQVLHTQLNALSPPGGQKGQTLDVVISGADLDFVDRLFFSHPAITAQPKMQDQAGTQVPIPYQFSVTIGAGVPPGYYEARAVGYFGVSNPRTFVVDDRPEAAEVEPNNDPAAAQPLPVGTILNAAGNGTADVDFFKITAAAGQRLVITVEAQRIDSRMQAQLELYDPSGRRVSRSRNGYRGDPVLDFTTTVAGDYHLRVTEFTYRGGAEYFYRLHVNTGPHIDFILPPAGAPGSTADYTLFGRNLPGGTPAGVTVDDVELQKLDVSIALPPRETELSLDENVTPEESSVDAFSYRLTAPEGTSNPVAIHYADAPVTLEQEPNDLPAQAQRLTLPAEVGGHFQQKLDVDHFVFDAKAGEVYFIDAYGQRLGKRTDPRFVLEQVTRTEQGEEQVKRITDQDDTAVTIGGEDFNTRLRDPSYRFQVPADGTYRLALSDRYRESRGDHSLLYRLVIRREVPDFRLLAFAYTPNPQPNQPGTPGVLNLEKGSSVEIAVLAHRLDGFDGNIVVKVEGLPAGVTCPGAVIGSGQTSARLIFHSDMSAAVAMAPVKVAATAVIDDPQQVRAVEQAFAAIKPAEDALPNLRKALDAPQQKVTELTAAVDAATKELAAKPDDEALKKKLADQEKQRQDAAAASEKAKADLAAGEAQLTAARNAWESARQARQAAAKPVTRAARTASLIWPGVPNAGQESVARMTRNLILSVTEAAAPFQTTIATEPKVIEINQSRQLLLPVKLERRNGFDADVNLTFAGFDPARSKLQVENKPLNKGESEGVRRIFIPKDSAPGAWTVYLSGQAQASLERNPKAIAQARDEQMKAEAGQKTAEETNKAAVDALQKSDAALKDADAKLKAATDAVTAADKVHKDAEAALTKSQQDAETAAGKFKESEAALATKKDELTKAKAVAAEAPDDQAKAEAAKQAEQQVQTATAAVEAANLALTKAKEAVTTAEADLKKKGDELAKVTADKQTAETAQKTAADAKARADADAKTAAEQLKTAQAAKTKADQNFNNVNNANKARNVNLNLPSTPVLLVIKPAPVELTAAVPNGGNLKVGTPLEVKVTIKRINGFAGPVDVKLPLPTGVTGVTAEPLTIPADQTEGVLKLSADANATTGALANMVIQAEMTFDGPAAVDAPIALTVAK